MKTMKKILAVLCASMMLFSFAACNKGETKKTTEETQEVSTLGSGATEAELMQNDYRGGALRTMELRYNIMNLMEYMKSGNDQIRSENPNSFWESEGYQDFVTTFLMTSIINDTQWLNEEESSWEGAVARTFSQPNTFTTESDGGYVKKWGEIKRIEKDEYTIYDISGKSTDVIPEWNISRNIGNMTANGVKQNEYKGNYEWHILYDCNRDWCKAYCTLTMDDENVPPITLQLFEYMRIDNDTFAIQTNRERLYIVLKPVEVDTNISKREIKEFYYSKILLTSPRASFTPFEPKPEYDAVSGEYISAAKKYNETMRSYAAINDKGDVMNLYGKNDSMFTADKDITRDWVFEETALWQAIVYKDDAMVVTTYNKLTEEYEQFTYALSTVSDSLKDELKALVDLNKLVGELEIPEAETEAPHNAYNPYTAEEMEAMGYTYDKDGNVLDVYGEIIIYADGRSTEATTEAATTAPGETLDSEAETTNTDEADATEATETTESTEATEETTETEKIQ